MPPWRQRLDRSPAAASLAGLTWPGSDHATWLVLAEQGLAGIDAAGQWRRWPERVDHSRTAFCYIRFKSREGGWPCFGEIAFYGTVLDENKGREERPGGNKF